jgi:hypothetical protein
MKRGLGSVYGQFCSVGIVRMIRLLLMTMLVLGIVGLGSDVAIACPNCKDTLAEHGGRLQYGYALSIALMIGAPFGILGGWGLAIYRMVRPRS